MEKVHQQNQLKADCENCYGLCCVALPFGKSADFAMEKEGGAPCHNLESNFRCSIHNELRNNGFKGCTVFECFGAGQKVSQITFHGRDWREDQKVAKEMFAVFPLMQQLHEMLLYLYEARSLGATKSIHKELQKALDETEQMTNLSPKSILDLEIHIHRTRINELLLRVSDLVRAKFNNKKSKKDLIGAKLRGANLKGSNFRGAWLIAADLREADMSMCDFIGSDLRDADLRGANLTGSIFLTQVQVNSANGDIHTKLPDTLKLPPHWLNFK
ncbi:pentapeptide repeat-containing protein [Robertmurraya kyonggiensis]|uniref:Pentapeptide repeat-containing protein n=1 Tax=Robertmurraya kyonggiensis TaxID=1037680 RepID=A0A4U1DBG0_9BACI|nr:pentapeptide repeat-containing protein [Robertmurraya kyonggiensis]TKC18816.1 pentapeptide repeat-containing protein [Robertmurraya kyonggiensis]